MSINSIQKLFKGKAQNQILGWGAGIILAVGTTTYLSRLARIAKSIVIITRSDFDKSSIQYVVHISFKNPVSQSIRVKYPFVKLSYQGTTLASSVPSNQVITIPANGTVEATLRIDFDKEKLLKTFPVVAAILFAGGKISLLATTLSGLVTIVGTSEFSKEETWKLGF